LDHTYYFHIADDKYWIYANSIMWGGSKRLKTVVEEYQTAKTAATAGQAAAIVADSTLTPSDASQRASATLTTLNEEFFQMNDRLLCADIYKPNTRQTQLYKGLCVMGFHFPSTTQWLTNKFVGNKKWDILTGKPGVDAACMAVGSVTGSVKLNFNDKCDDLSDEVKRAIKGPFFAQDFPRTLLPFWGRFWNKLIQAESLTGDKMLELKEGEEKNWSAVWAAMWLHGRFQGFPNLEKRRNLGGLKGEYTLGTLTFPAHFGTPEDSS